MILKTNIFCDTMSGSCTNGFHAHTFRVPMHPGNLKKYLNFILKVQGLEIYLNFVKNPGIFNKVLEKKRCQLNMALFWWNFAYKLLEI